LCKQPQWPRRFASRRPLHLGLPAVDVVITLQRSSASPHTLVHPHPQQTRSWRAGASQSFPCVKQTQRTSPSSVLCGCLMKSDIFPTSSISSHVGYTIFCIMPDTLLAASMEEGGGAFGRGRQLAAAGSCRHWSSPVDSKRPTAAMAGWLYQQLNLPACIRCLIAEGEMPIM